MMQNPMRRFSSLLKQYRQELRQIYIYAVLIGLVNLTLPLGIQAIVNYIQMGEVTSSWVVLVFFVLVGIAVAGALQVLQLRVVENIQQNLFVRSAIEFAYRLPKITFIQLDKIHAPELVNRFFDTLTIQKGLPKILIDFSLAAFQIIFGLILLAIYSPYFIILGAFLVLLLWLIFKITGPKGLDTSLKESKYKYALAHWLEEVARVNRSFKMQAANRFHLQRTDEITSNYVVAREKHFKLLLQQFRLFVGFKVLVAAALLVLGGALVIQEQMNVGQFVAAEIVILLIINSIEKILRTIDTIYDVLTALEKIGYVTDLALDKDAGKAMLDQDEPIGIKACNLQFSFPEEAPIIKDLSFEVAPLSKVLLTGKSGSGKSLLLQLIARLHELNAGDLLINGRPNQNYGRDELYANVGLVFPSNQIFEGTFRENILLGRKVDEQYYRELLQLLGLDLYLSRKEQGEEVILDSGGRRLPRSIIQKILIARVIVAQPRLLLIEDPLQFLQEEEKIKIIDYLMDKKRPWTLIVVSDFYYWKDKCTQIIQL